MELPMIDFGQYLLGRSDEMWTFTLVLIRFIAAFTILPGFGTQNGMTLRYAGVLTMAFAAFHTSPVVPVPEDLAILTSMCVSEALFGMTLSLIPLLLVAGVQIAGSLSATTMGLGAAQLMDPTLGASVSSLARLFGDIVVLLFLLLDGHHVVIYVVSGMGGTIVPGSFWLGDASMSLMLDRFGDIFRVGVMISAPVIVALLLTNFVMGLITKAIPQVNIFIVSFPLTIGIGLVLSALSLPEIVVFMEREIVGVESSILVLIEDVVLRPAS